MVGSGSMGPHLCADSTQVTILCLVLSLLFRLLLYLNIPPAHWLKIWKDLGCEVFFKRFNTSYASVRVVIFLLLRYFILYWCYSCWCSPFLGREIQFTWNSWHLVNEGRFCSWFTVSRNHLYVLGSQTVEFFLSSFLGKRTKAQTSSIVFPTTPSPHPP